ncbi:hypothetical protein FACS1894169_09880 [Bacteroidia bacterium]|nr:hypothetical protein FACS1894169_09880 [Bacteroidia bacterium]
MTKQWEKIEDIILDAVVQVGEFGTVMVAKFVLVFRDFMLWKLSMNRWDGINLLIGII